MKTPSPTPPTPLSIPSAFGSNHRGVLLLFLLIGVTLQSMADFTMTDTQAATYASACRFSELTACGAFAGYTMPGAPSQGNVVCASYYDNHDFITLNSLPPEFGFRYVDGIYGSARAGLVARGLLTGVYTGKGYEAYYYNLQGLPVQTYATGFNAGRVNTFYNTMGDVNRRVWELPDGTVRTQQWTYDAMRRPTGITVSYLGEGGKTITQTVEYNGAGLPSKETWGSASKTMSYDVAGRLMKWSVSLQKPKPPRPTGVAVLSETPPKPPSHPRPNSLFEILGFDAAGRVSSKEFYGGAYNYSYDTRGRLVSASISGSSDFSETYTYDDRCNMTSLVRKGVVDRSGSTEIFGTLDNMTFSYTGNKLTSMTNTTEALAFEG
ncbi:MAG: hypothetical protein K2H15_05520, partial [Muribaculaceae bacterium]|nr:hypothetical protein [Muribaculaceae bacterium]